MTRAQRVLNDALATGVANLGGEMSIPIDNGPQAAFDHAYRIACECGYMVGWRYGHSAFSVSGGDMGGQFVLDWFHGETLLLGKIELWTCEEAYAPMTASATPGVKLARE